jgi:hypothetical protein
MYREGEERERERERTRRRKKEVSMLHDWKKEEGEASDRYWYSHHKDIHPSQPQLLTHPPQHHPPPTTHHQR